MERYVKLCEMQGVCYLNSSSDSFWGSSKEFIKTLVVWREFFCPHSVVCRTSVPPPGTKPRPWQWKHKILTAKQPGNSPKRIIEAGRNVLYHDDGVDYVIICICQNLQNCTKRWTGCQALWPHITWHPLHVSSQEISVQPEFRICLPVLCMDRWLSLDGFVSWFSALISQNPQCLNVTQRYSF